MIIVTAILMDNNEKTIGAELNINGNIKRLKTDELKTINIEIANAIIDCNGYVRAKHGNLQKIKINNRPNTVVNKEINQAKEILKKQELIVYHGNKDYNIIPKFRTGKINNDYGRGFYTTPDKELAKEWAWGSYTTGNKAYVHSYKINMSNLNIFNLTELDSLHWIAELLSNRKINLNSSEALQDTQNKLIKKYKINTDKYDIIIGYRADDSYFKYALAFLESRIYKETLEQALRFGALGLQVFIKSPRAFKRLDKINIEEVSRTYESRYKKREQQALQEYSRLQKNQTSRIKETIHDFI